MISHGVIDAVGALAINLDALEVSRAIADIKVLACVCEAL